MHSEYMARAGASGLISDTEGLKTKPAKPGPLGNNQYHSHPLAKGPSSIEFPASQVLKLCPLQACPSLL